MSGRCRLGLGCLRRASPGGRGGPRGERAPGGAPRGQSPSAPWRTSPRACLPTLRGVSASKILGVGRVPSWGATQTLGGPGGGVVLERVGKAAWGWAGDLAAGGGAGGGGPACAPARRCGGPVGALPVRAVTRAWASAEGQRCPGVGVPPWAAQLLQLYREASFDQLPPLSPDASPWVQLFVHLEGVYGSTPFLCSIPGGRCSPCYMKFPGSDVSLLCAASVGAEGRPGRCRGDRGERWLGVWRTGLGCHRHRQFLQEQESSLLVEPPFPQM